MSDRASQGSEGSFALATFWGDDVPQTVTVELFAPTIAKQETFRQMQAEFNRLANELAEASLGALSDQASETLEWVVPTAWHGSLYRMVQGRLSSMAARGKEARLTRFKPHHPVVFDPAAWQLSAADGAWKLTIPVFGRTVSVPILVPSGQVSRLTRMLEAGMPLEGRLYQKKGRWYFAATYLNRANELHGPLHMAGRRPVGVDLGQRMLAVAVDPVRNRRLLLSGKDVLFHRKRYERICKRLRKAGTPAARRAAKRVEAKYARFLEHRERRVANAILRFAAPSAPNPIAARLARRVVIKFEDFQTAPASAEVASYRRIQGLVARRAELAGIPVVAVSRHETSQRCSACGAVQEGNRREQAYVCSCGYRSHADLNAARNIAQAAIRSEGIGIVPAGYESGSQAVGTAVSQAVLWLKGTSDHLRSAFAHATPQIPPSLAVKTQLTHMEVIQMASIVKDLTESSTKFVTGSLDNLKTYVDRTSDELGKVDMVGVTRRVLDTAIDNTKAVVKMAAEPNGLDFFGKAKAVADGSLEAAKEVVNTISEEGKKTDFFGMATRMTMDSLSSLRNQVDLTIETTKSVSNRLMPLATTTKPVATRAPQVTRVEIEQEKPSKASKS
jgi:hypothetical protein